LFGIPPFGAPDKCIFTKNKLKLPVVFVLCRKCEAAFLKKLVWHMSNFRVILDSKI
jgi:hypothetical protein